jgi:hypothetical protein
LQQLLESWSSSPSLAEQFALFDEFFRLYLFFRLSTLGVLPGENVLLGNNFASQAEAQLPVLLEPLTAIRQAPSDTAVQVKDKGRLHVKFERARGPFRQVGDLWSATFTREG